MKINIRENSVEIEGYVNAIERYSKPLMSRVGRFIERICKGAFAKAIKRNNDIHILLNHDWNRDLGSTAKGNLELVEDNIGLRARATIFDEEVVEKARNGQLVGWSFGFSDRDVVNSVDNSGMPTRAVKDLDLYEVSILDRRKSPAYEGTLISARSESDEIHFRGEEYIDEIEILPNGKIMPEMENKKEEQKKEKVKVTETITEKTIEKVTETEEVTEETKNRSEQQDDVVENKEKSIDYSQYENMIKEMKGEN